MHTHSNKMAYGKYEESSTTHFPLLQQYHRSQNHHSFFLVQFSREDSDLYMKVHFIYGFLYELHVRISHIAPDGRSSQKYLRVVHSGIRDIHPEKPVT